jgi:hypothetical protein
MNDSVPSHGSRINIDEGGESPVVLTPPGHSKWILFGKRQREWMKELNRMSW